MVFGTGILTRKVENQSAQYPNIRISVRASFFGATITARPAVPRGYLLASVSDPKVLALMISSLGTPNKAQWRPRLGKLKTYFVIQLPARSTSAFVSLVTIAALAYVFIRRLIESHQRIEEEQHSDTNQHTA